MGASRFLEFGRGARGRNRSRRQPQRATEPPAENRSRTSVVFGLCAVRETGLPCFIGGLPDRIHYSSLQSCQVSQ